MLTQSREPGLQFQLQDILAVMVGYGMAALLFRAFWPDSRPTPVVGVPAIGLYLWLGMAMSGPVILLQRRSRLSHSPVPPHQLAPSRSYTWAELAWLLIGTYWIVVGLFVIPARLHEFRLGDMILFGLVPIAVALAFRILGPRPAREGETKHAWTHNAGVVVVATWPIAWICLIVLGRTMR